MIPFLKHCLDNLCGCLRVPVALLRGRPRPTRLVKLRALRTLLLDCKVPRKDPDVPCVPESRGRHGGA